jgi:hypothetical protein
MMIEDTKMIYVGRSETTRLGGPMLNGCTQTKPWNVLSVERLGLIFEPIGFYDLLNGR